MYPIDTFAVAITPIAGDVQECEVFLTQKTPIPIVARISNGAIICDPRTLIDDEELEHVADGLKAYFESIA